MNRRKFIRSMFLASVFPREAKGKFQIPNIFSYNPDESISSLKETFQKRDVTFEESVRSIYSNIVRFNLYSPRKEQRPTESYGLMITEDGWIVTPYNPLKEDFRKWSEKIFQTEAEQFKVKTRSNESYEPDKTIWTFDKEKDIALIKARTSGKTKPKRFFSRKEDINPGENITLFTGNYSITFDAKIESINRQKNTFTINRPNIPCFIGSPCISYSGEYLGTVIGSTKKDRKIVCTGSKNLAELINTIENHL